jgi:gentisate 1,2-dioxygenase
MEQNDLILTPSWTWHEHANRSDHDILWLDALDFPLVNLLQASLFGPSRGDLYANRQEGLANARLSVYRPKGWKPYADPMPGVRYPWAEMRASLDGLGLDDGDPFDGLILEYTNPVTGGPTLPTMSCRAQLIRAGRRTLAHRASSNTVYFVISGRGRTIIQGTLFEWSPGDVFVVPNWQWHEHAAGNGEDCLLFSITDEPALEALGFFREEPYREGDGHQMITSTFT